MSEQDDLIPIEVPGNLSDVIKKELRAQIAMYGANRIPITGLAHHLHSATDDFKLDEGEEALVIAKHKKAEGNRLIGTFKRKGSGCLRRLRTGQDIDPKMLLDAIIMTGDDEARCLKYAGKQLIEDAKHYWQAKVALRTHEDKAIQMDFDFVLELFGESNSSFVDLI